ncbi:MAG: hypothetical protein ACRDS1_11465, partial [Pseudonocardiaceae bacterium]
DPMNNPNNTQPPTQPTTDPTRTKSNWKKWVLGGLAVIIAGQLYGLATGEHAASGSSATYAGTSPSSSIPSGSLFSSGDNELDDVVVSRCNTTENIIGMADIAVQITNSTNRVQSYWVTVSINDANGNRLEEANGAANSIRPGQSATATLLASGVEGAASCEVADVSRIPQW